jgi:Zn-dependent protease with chaperone function
MAYQLALLTVFTLIGALLDLPFELYVSTFGVEQRFGFNRITPALFMVDLLKGTLVGALIGLPLAALILWIMGARRPVVAVGLGRLGGLQPAAAGAVPHGDRAAVQQVRAAGRRSPEDPRAGADAALRLCRQGPVRDGRQPRSAHANAYFTGLGAAKRVVFFDTLLARLSPGEVEAVLAHELGHFRHRHVLKRIVLIFGLPAWPGWRCWAGWRARAASTPAWACAQPGGAQRRAGAAAVRLALPPFMFFVSPLAAQLSRRHEFEADAYACAQARRPRPGQRAAEAARGQRRHADARPAVRALLLFAPAGVASGWPRCPRRLAGMSRDPRATRPRRRPKATSGLVVGAHGRHAWSKRPTANAVLCHPRGKKSDWWWATACAGSRRRRRRDRARGAAPQPAVPPGRMAHQVLRRQPRPCSCWWRWSRCSANRSSRAR